MIHNAKLIINILQTECILFNVFIFWYVSFWGCAATELRQLHWKILVLVFHNFILYK